MRYDHDVVVVGGGPAGAAAAGRLRRRGHGVLVLESEPFPRFHVGESLLPLGNFVFDQIGVADKVRAAGFHPKRGAQLLTDCGEHRVVFDFVEKRIEPSETVQVPRAQFDQLMLEHARALGAEVVTARARDFVIDADGVAVTFVDAGGASRTVRAQAVVDASGRAGFVARRMGVRVADDELKKASIYAHFRGVRRDAGPRGADTRISCLPDLGWMWWIPLDAHVTSVGVVLDLDDYRALGKGDLEEMFWRVARRSPVASALLAEAERVGEFRAESGFSYGAERYCGPRWLLAGDAGSFLDPVWSTGVQMALQSGVEAADACVAGWLQPRPDPAAALRRYERTLQRRYAFVRRFVTGFYDPAVRDLFFAPRRILGIDRAVTRVLAGGFDLALADRLRLRLFFLLGRLQRRFELVPRRHGARAPAAAPVPDHEPMLER
ncbi:MAG: tryptophan 7-halogenase [Planctomycetes bacterium]|nr:tryptophan 7-halogenase [Planctomycetota bacterium]